MDAYTKNNLLKFTDEDAIFEPQEVQNWRKPINSIEAEGVYWMFSKWITDKLYFYDYTMEDVYDNIHPWRDNQKGGSFNLDENYKLLDQNDVLEINDVILSENGVYLEIYNVELDKPVDYIKIN